MLIKAVVAADLLAVILLAGCSRGVKEEAAEPATPVQVARATRGSIQHTITANAILFPLNQANVTSKISAPVRKIFVNRGDHVKQGQLLATLESRDLGAAAQESKELYDQAQAAYQTTTGATVLEDKTKAIADARAAQQALDATRKVYESRLNLFHEGALARKLVDDAQVAMVQAQSQYDTAQRHLESFQQVSERQQVKSAEAQLAAAQAHYQSAEAQLSYAEIHSPINGIVSDRPVYPGEMANSGSPIISVVDISQVVARANIPVKEAGAIQAGRPATISEPDVNISGRVTVVSPAVDPNTTTIEVWVQAVNTGERLKPGSTVQVSINAETVNDAVLIPPAALLSSDEGGEKVMVVEADSLAHERRIEVGIRQPDEVQILSGVKEGDQVITFGGLGLEDKAKVTIEQQSQGEAPEKSAEGETAKPDAKGTGEQP
ncbi:MAG: efflux RND transporter periplasmic adaptor subunit [Acidobacteriaceae bacterium]|nr:efflux RND transporter periplasmic adaptor subunit [Acidobacteriaceae bacterium]MBV9779475.1 efflux RND transporter periplasmic adaptor subunit [Acidobacteriaceae bacterium]